MEGNINIRIIFKIMTGNKITVMCLLIFFSKCYYSDISGVVLFYKKNVCKKSITLSTRYKKMKLLKMFSVG